MRTTSLFILSIMALATLLTVPSVAASQILDAHTAVSHPRPGPVKHRQEGVPRKLLFWLTYGSRSQKFQEHEELINFLVDQRDKTTGSVLYDIMCVVETSNSHGLIEKENLRLAPFIMTGESEKDQQQRFITQSFQGFELAMGENQDRVNDIMSMLEVPFLLLDGFVAASDPLILPYESPKYRHTLNLESSYIADTFGAESPITHAYKSLASKFSEVYYSLMLEEDKKFAPATSPQAQDKDKAIVLQGILKQIEFYAKFGTKHLEPVVKDAAFWTRHDLEIKFILAQQVLAGILGTWMLASMFREKMRHQSTAERILQSGDDDSKKKTK